MYYKKKLHAVTACLGIFIFSLALTSTLFFYKIPLPEDRLSLSIVEFSAFKTQDLDKIPPQSWATITLPDDWRKQDENRKGIVSGWYRTHIKLATLPEHPLAILIASPRMNIAVYLNHNLLGQGGRFDDPVARNWWTPLLFSIPASLLKVGKNTLHIYLKTDQAGAGYLPELHLAPYENLINSYASHYFFRVTSIQFITLLLFLQSGIFALLWYFRKHEVYYGYYAIGALLWGLHNLTLFTVHIPVNRLLWDWFSYTTLGFYAFISVIFFHRFFAKKVPHIERPMLIFAVLCAAVLYFLEEKAFYFVAQTLWYPAAYLAGVYGLLFLVMNTWKNNNTESQIITLSGFVIMLYAGHDILVFHGLIDWAQGYFIQYAAVILLIGFTLILLRRFISAQYELNTLRKDIAPQLENKTAELEMNKQKLLRLENQHARSGDRARLILDMHDGVGGSLVSILATIELGKANMQQISGALRDTLNDIQLMIDSMDIQENDLTVVLGMFRTRIDRRLRNSEISLEWDIHDMPSIPSFDSGKALLVLRILQEVISHVIKQGRATKIRLSAYQFQDRTKGSAVVIEVCDNSKSLSTDKHVREKLQHRARSVGYRLYFESNLSGTQVRLLLPLEEDSTTMD